MKVDRNYGRRPTLMTRSLPNEWSPDSADDGIVKDVFLFGMKGKRTDSSELYRVQMLTRLSGDSEAD